MLKIVTKFHVQSSYGLLPTSTFTSTNPHFFAQTTYVYNVPPFLHFVCFCLPVYLFSLRIFFLPPSAEEILYCILIWYVCHSSGMISSELHWKFIVTAICFMSFGLFYAIIISFMFFNYTLYVCFLVLYVLLSILCVPCCCIALFIVSPHLHSCLFYICVQFLPTNCVETQLQLINIISTPHC